MMVWKMIFLFQGCILRFHVKLQGCIIPKCWNVSWWWLPYGRIRQQKKSPTNLKQIQVYGKRSAFKPFQMFRFLAIFVGGQWMRPQVPNTSSSHGTYRSKKLANDGRCDQAVFVILPPKNGFRPNAVKPDFLSNKFSSVSEIWRPWALGKV